MNAETTTKGNSGSPLYHQRIRKALVVGVHVARDDLIGINTSVIVTSSGDKKQ